MRVEPEELGTIRSGVVKDGDRYGGADLEGAVVDGDHALFEAGLTDPEVKSTGELHRMVVYTCRPGWSPANEDDVTRRLEEAWVADGAFAHEAHSITVEGHVVVLDFVTWWDSGAFYTGRIEVALPSER